MFRLTRQVRFAVNRGADWQLSDKIANGYAGYPPLADQGQFFQLAVTVSGELGRPEGYLLNIKDIDRAVREQVIPLFGELIGKGSFGAGGQALVRSFQMLRSAFRDVKMHEVRLALTPFCYIAVHWQEFPMVRFSQKFEFSASHRLHNPALSESENRALYGKCNNPHGHGHNYEVQVTVAGEPDERGVVIPITELETIVADTIIERLDHKNLNVEVAEFQEIIPSVENIAMVIYRLLKPRFEKMKGKLASVTVWETPKTWCEYAED